MLLFIIVAAAACRVVFDQVDRDLRTEEQLYGNSSSNGSSYSRPAAYTYAYGGRRADADDGFEDFFRRTAAGSGGSSGGGTYQSQARAGPGPSAGGGGGGAAGRGQAGGSRWYDNNHWADNDDEDLESDEDEYDGYGHGGSGWHYSNPRSKY